MSLKKTELATLVQHYKLEVPSTMKSDICKMLVEYLVDEEIVSDDEHQSGGAKETQAEG